MKSIYIKIFAGLALSTILSQSAFATSGRQQPITNEIDNDPIAIPKPLEAGSTFVDISLFESESCKAPKPQPQGNSALGGSVALVIDIGLALIGKVLEDKQEGLMATYAGSKTAIINSRNEPGKELRCIKVERKEKAIEGKEDEVLATLELLVKDVTGFSEARRLVVKKLEVKKPAPSKSKSRSKTRLNYAVSVGFVTVDSDGKERALSRNLPLIENVPLSGKFGKDGKEQGVEITPEDKDKLIASSVFAKLPNSMVTTVTVSITETDSKFSKAEKVSDFFDDNMSIIDTALGEILD